jgi:hypothetical protein
LDEHDVFGAQLQSTVERLTIPLYAEAAGDGLVEDHSLLPPKFEAPSVASTKWVFPEVLEGVVISLLSSFRLRSARSTFIAKPPDAHLESELKRFGDPDSVRKPHALKYFRAIGRGACPAGIASAAEDRGERRVECV